MTIIGYGELHLLPHYPLNSLVTSNSLNTRQLVVTRLFSDSKQCHFWGFMYQTTLHYFLTNYISSTLFQLFCLVKIRLGKEEHGGNFQPGSCRNHARFTPGSYRNHAETMLRICGGARPPRICVQAGGCRNSLRRCTETG